MAALVLVGLTATSSVVAARDWLDVRRGGAPEIIAAARTSSAPVAWVATYATALPVGHLLAAGAPAEKAVQGEPASGNSTALLQLTIARGPPAVKGAAGDLLVRIDAPKQLKGSGIWARGGKAWVRFAGGKAQVATTALLTQLIAGLQVPWLAFAPLEVSAMYAATLEGEFGDVAVLRCRPDYVAGPGLPPLKVGVSKRFGIWVLGEVNDRQGQPLAQVEALDIVHAQGVAVGERLRIIGSGSAATALVLQRTSLTVGQPLKWSAKLLQ